MKTRVRAKIAGRVQGVGFRPTVYRYATQHGLAGFVCNGPQGVTVEVEGDDHKIGAFFDHLTAQPPRQAVIAGIQTEVLRTLGYRGFQVVESEATGEVATQVSPDLAMCEDCRREISDRKNRRHGYAFTNCTNCGPRFTIIRGLPYDRDKTSMAGFAMCQHCEHEYHAPADRRFHAQPNACPVCGPQLELRVVGGAVTADEPLARAQELLRRGRIVAIKGIGGYHLACDALSREAIARLRQRKHRPHKSFAVMFRDLATVRKYCRVTEAEEAELLSVARPIVVLEGRVPGVSPDTRTVGALLPYTPLHDLLMKDFDALVMTSGNLTDEPIVSEETELSRLTGIADAVLTHNRPIVHKCDDSVVRIVAGQRQFLRRSRGFTPNPIRLAEASPQILAVGGELKNTFCLVRDGQAFVSQHIGDLKDARTYANFTGEIEAWKKLLRIEPSVFAHDMHPAYLSTRFCGDGIAVQHHHAHIASVMAEHGLHEPIIGVALDGTGYGTDGTIWGGEFMVADRQDFERVAHFKPYALPGGDKAIAEPWRMAASVLHAEQLIPHFSVTIVTKKCGVLWRMIESGVNAPLTSSAGRLFDAVAAMLGLCERASYEAQAAIRLEAAADPSIRDAYPFAVETSERPWQVRFDFRALLEDKRAGVPVSEMAGKFHNTVAGAIVRVCRYLRGQRDLHRVALSGGVFQNELLLRRTVEGLQSQRFEVFTNQLVPPNDGGLSLGQAVVAAARFGVRQPAAALQRKQRPCV
jgi:hydrogenase maturation protein HypF